MRTIKRTLGKMVRNAARAVLAEELAAPRPAPAGAMEDSFRRVAEETRSVNKGVQILLSLKYQEMLWKGEPLPAFEEVEFRSFSQNGEDGILLYLFSLLGTTNKRVVEICAGDGTECNAANLIIHHGWEGLLFDGDEENVRRGRRYYQSLKDTRLWPPTLVHSWITAENVNALVCDHGFDGEIDLLSLDLDGNDYWIWKSLTGIQPRVVVLEYQSLLGPDRALTIPYQDDFQAELMPYGPDYAGASLPAFVKLGREKGYRLVGCQSYGFNAFFVRDDVGIEVLPEMPARDCFRHPKLKFDIEERFPRVATRDWVEV